MKEFEAVDCYGDKLTGRVVDGNAFLTAVSKSGSGCEVELIPGHADALRDWLAEHFDAPTAPKLVIPECDTTEDAAQPQGVSDVDKLRVVAAVVNAQAPSGTDLADFKRRLQIVLGL